MTSVKNADPNTRSIVAVIKNIVGPCCVDPVCLASHPKAYLTGNNRNNVHPKQTNKTHNAVNPEPAFTRATLSANKVHPTTSLPTPAERTTMPTVVSRSLSSVRMRQRTGKAVMENATPVKSIKCVKAMLWSMKWWYTGTANAEPRPNGRIIPARATVKDILAFRLIIEPSISRPTRKRNRQRPAVHGQKNG